MGVLLEKYRIEEKPRRYELVFLVAPTFTEREANEISREYQDSLKQIGCKITHRESWKLRKLAYPIRKFTSAYYFLLNFEVLPSRLAEIRNMFHSDTRILRHMIVRMDKWHIEFRERRKREMKHLPRTKRRAVEGELTQTEANLKKEIEYVGVNPPDKEPSESEVPSEKEDNQ